MEINKRKIMIFLGLTFTINWSMAGIFYVSGTPYNTYAGLAMATAYMFVPMVSAIIVQKLIYKEAVIEPLGISWKINKWFFVAWLLPPIIAFATFGISLLFPGVQFTPDMAGMFESYEQVLTPEQISLMKSQIEALPVHLIWITLVQGLIAGVTINAIAGFGEELGWRGLLLKELLPLGFWKSSGIIGFIWGLWHAPLILQGHNYPQHPVFGVLMMIIWCMLLTPIMNYIRLKAKSVIAAAIYHGSLNGTVGLSILMIRGGTDLTVGITGLAGFIALIIVNLMLFIYMQYSADDPVSDSL